MDAQGHHHQVTTSAARLSPVASTSSYFLQLDAAGRIEIMDSSLVHQTSSSSGSAGGTRTIELGTGGGGSTVGGVGGGDETVYEIRDDDYTFLSGQFMEQGLQEIDPVDITDLLENNGKSCQSYTIEESTNNIISNAHSSSASSFTTLTNPANSGYEGGISIMDSSGRIHHHHHPQSFSLGNDSSSSLIGVSNNQLMSSMNNVASSYSSANANTNTFPMNSSNVQYVHSSQSVPIMNCDILDPSQLNNARVVVTSHSSSSHEHHHQTMNKSPMIISEPIQIMEQGMQHPIAVIHVPELSGQSFGGGGGGTSQDEEYIMTSQGQLRTIGGRQISFNQISNDDVKIVYSNSSASNYNNNNSSSSSNQNSQSSTSTVEVYNSGSVDTEASSSQTTSNVSEVNSFLSQSQSEGDVSSQATTVELESTEMEDDDSDEMTIRIVSCYSQCDDKEEEEVVDQSTTNSKLSEIKEEKVEEVEESELVEPSTTPSLTFKEPILVRKPRIHPWLCGRVDDDDELLIAYKNRPQKDCAKTSLCGFCYVWEDNEETLEEHIKLKHNKLRLYECATCGARFIARIHLKRHQKLHKYDLELPWCKYSTKNLDPRKAKNHFVRRFRPAPLSDAYREHISDVLEQITSLQYDCFDCGESFPEEELARDHYEKKHAIHTCRHCCKVLDKWDDLINHEESQHGEYSIHQNYIGGAWFLWDHWLCEESVKKEEIISNIYYFHNYAEKKDKDSKIYLEEFVDASTLMNEARNKPTDLNVSKDHVLSESENTFDSSLYSDSTGEDTEPSVKIKQPARRRSKKRTRDEMDDDIYSGTLAFQCDQCPKSYDNEHDLKRHGRCHSSDKQPLTCQYCQKSFKTHSHKKEHERTHTGEKPYTCPICNRSFIQSSNLKKHIQTHKSENTLQCKICNKQFIKESSLVLHQRAHALDRKFRCEVCDRAYNYASLLKRHMRIHTGELPYSCDICGMLFHELVSLHYHRKKIHTGERPHKCDICGRAFILSSDLKKHLQIHTKSPIDRVVAPKISRRRSQIKSIESDSSRNDGETIMEQGEEDTEQTGQNSVSIMEIPASQASVIMANQNAAGDETRSPKKVEETRKEIRVVQILEPNSTPQTQNPNSNTQTQNPTSNLQTHNPSSNPQTQNPNSQIPHSNPQIQNPNSTQKIAVPKATSDASNKSKPPILRVYKKGPPKKQSIQRNSSHNPRIAPAPARTQIPLMQPGQTIEHLDKNVSVIQHSYTPSTTNVTLAQNMNTTSDVSFVQLSNNGDQASYVIVSYDGLSMMAIPQVSDATTLHLQDSTSFVPATNSQNVISQPFQTQILDGQPTDVYATSFDAVMSGSNKTFQNMEIIQASICEPKPNDVDIMNDFNNIIVEAPDVSEEVTVNECDSLMAWE